MPTTHLGVGRVRRVRVRRQQQVFYCRRLDTQWAIFCDAFGLDDLKADARQPTTTCACSRATAIRAAAASANRRAVLHGGLRGAGACPMRQSPRPEDLFDDPHLLATGNWPDHACGGQQLRGRAPIEDAALLPLAFDRQRLPLRHAARRRRCPGCWPNSDSAAAGYIARWRDGLRKRPGAHDAATDCRLERPTSGSPGSTGDAPGSCRSS